MASSPVQGEKKGLNARCDYRSLAIVEAFPNALDVLTGEDEEFCRMRGASIVKIGTTNDADLEGGGLLIDYIPIGETAVHRAVFAFNDRGLWPEADIILPMKASDLK